MGSDYAGHASVTGHRHFNPRSPDGERLFLVFCSAYSSSHFNPRSPDGERLPFAGGVLAGIDISIHAPRMGSDSAVSSTNLRSSPFQSTLPGWGATVGWSLMVVTCMDFNPRSPDGERLAHRLSNVSLMTLFQSTLPGWGATKDGTRHPCPPPISIHAPRMGSDCCVLRIIKMHNAFQSTLPGWGATEASRTQRKPLPNFNPRSPDGERPDYSNNERAKTQISIHAPRMGSDRGKV